MDKFEEKVLNTLENLEASGVIESKPEKVFAYAADIHFEDGDKVVFTFTSKNKEDYNSAYHTVCASISELGLFTDRGRFTVGNITEIEDRDNFFDEKFETFLSNQNDNIDNAVLALVHALARNKKVEWNAEWGGLIVNAIIPILSEYGIKCCYPYYGIEEIVSADDPELKYGAEHVPCYRDGVRCEYSGEVCMFCNEHCIIKDFNEPLSPEIEEECK